jgi:hypothetical protein
MESGKFQLITEADLVLSPCGRFVPPVGSVVYIPKSFLIQAVVPVASEQTFYKEITGDTTWCWRSISIALSGNPPAISAQVLAPDDGHFLFNGLLNLTAVAGFGSNRFLLSREIECPPGSKIVLSLDDNFLLASAVQPVSVLCGGAYAYYLKNGIRSRTAEQEASALPRIFAGVNQNILAPCWMNGLGPMTPGRTDELYTYGDGNSNLAKVTLGGVLSAKASIEIDDAYDFQVRRFLFDVIPDAGVTAGSFLVRVRAGSGYVFTDDYVILAKYAGSTYFAKGWDIKHGDQMQFDLTLVDGAGAGSISIQCLADGVRRRVK